MFRRINITGNAGSGKSTVASQFGGIFEIPVYELDSIVWKPNWEQTEGEERNKLIRELVDKDTWIIDGVSKIIREAADLVIFLDVPRRVCLYRCLKRNGCYMFNSRPGLPDNCPEILILPTLLRIIWDFPKTVRPKIISEAQVSKKYRHISSEIQLNSIYAEIAT